MNGGSIAFIRTIGRGCTGRSRPPRRRAATSRPSTDSGPATAATWRCRIADGSCGTARDARCAWSAPWSTCPKRRARRWACARADVLGQELASVIVPPAYRDAHRQGLTRYLATGESTIIGGRIEVTALRADGTEFPAELTVTAPRVGAPPAFGAYVRDLTEQRRADTARASLEMQLQQSQKMEAIGRLAGGVAHDFNNLLTVITGRAHMLLGRLRPGEPLHRDVELIQKTSQRAVALTSQLLAFSRKQVVQPRVVELGPLMAELVPMLQRMIREDVELAVEPVEGSGRVKVDPSQMQQVLMNLAGKRREGKP